MTLDPPSQAVHSTCILYTVLAAQSRLVSNKKDLCIISFLRCEKSSAINMTFLIVSSLIFTKCNNFWHK